MGSSRTLALSAVAGTAFAVLLIAFASFTGGTTVLRTTTGPEGTTSTVGNSQAATTGSAAPGQGTLSILLTDPPRVPEGVTAVYIAYSGVSIHGFRGWVDLNASGSVELMGTVNYGLTLSSKDLPVGTYDLVRFDVNDATVTFNGKNYTAVVQSGSLTIAIRGGATVSNSQPAAAIIDMQPVVMNIGSASAPKFVLRPFAMAFPVPPLQVSPEMGRFGFRFYLRDMQWWNADQIAASANLQISGSALSSDSLNLTLKNDGSDPIQVRLVVVSNADPSPIGSLQDSLPVSMFDSAVFVVFPNGTLVQFTPLIHPALLMQGMNTSSSFIGYLLKGGLNLTAGASQTLSYGGQITMGFGDVMTASHMVTSGSDYWVTVISDQTVTSMEVTAT